MWFISLGAYFSEPDFDVINGEKTISSLCSISSVGSFPGKFNLQLACSKLEVLKIGPVSSSANYSPWGPLQK